MNTFQPGTAVVAPATQVEITVSCRNLADQDVFSKSDPMCVLNVGDFRTKKYHEHGRTEMIKDCLNPDFVKKFIIDYLFEERQMLRFEIYDVDSPSQKLDHHDFLGFYECSLGELVSAGGKVEKKLQGRTTGRGVIILRTEEVSSCKEEALMQFKASNLDKKDFFGKSDPYLVFHRANADGSFTVVHKTEVVKNNLNPTWRPFTLSVRVLCNGDYDRSIRVECFDWDSDGSHDFIGEFQSNMRTFSKGPGSSNVYPVINPHKKKKKKNYTNSGVVDLLMCRIQQQHTFLDFIKGGMQMNFTVAIDFTASNGNPANPTSLHYINPHQPNQYAAAIQAVGEIIQDYDSDKLFPVLGFGAKLPTGQVSHEFALNFNPTNPYVAGVDGILQVYHQAIQRVQLYGPTNFAPVINHVSKFASACPDGSNYFVLLIITDGVITDMANTIEAIVRASTLPMSIIIVGVGNDDFDSMNLLDADDQRLSSNGRYAERDIVQFVPFRNFVGGRYGSDLSISKAYLAKEVLAEIPGQVTEYMKKRNIKPKPPQERIAVPGSVSNNTGTAAYGTQGGQMGSHGQPGIQGGQPGIQGGQPGIPGGQPGIQGGQPGIQGGQPGIQGGQPGIQGGQPGIQGGQPGIQGGQPGIQGGQPGIQGQSGTYGQPGSGHTAPVHAPQAGDGVGVPGAGPYQAGNPPAPYPSGALPGNQQGTGPQGGIRASGYAPSSGSQQWPAPYPGGANPSQAPYPAAAQGTTVGPGGQQARAPYPGAGPPGQFPNQGMQQQASAPPYFGGAPPYPGGTQQGSAPYPRATAPYPGGAPNSGTTAPYPGGGAPYSGSAPNSGTAPYPGGGAPYPGATQQGSAPYPSAGAPYPGGGAVPYPGVSPPQSAPYPQGSAPYPGGDQKGPSGMPYPPGPQNAQTNAPVAPPRRTAPGPPGSAPPPYPGS